MLAAPTVVKMHNQSYTLTAPASAATDWDATICFTGANTEIGQNPGLVTGSYDNLVLYDHAGFVAGMPFGTFVVKAGASGTKATFGIPATAAGDTNVAFGGCSVDPSQDRCRIIAVAFEVTNTTADIYKQGSCTVAMLPSAVNDYSTVECRDSNAIPHPQASYQSWNSPTYASERSDLMTVPGSQTWAAKDGLYAIPRMVTHTMPVDSPSWQKRSAVVKDTVNVAKWHITGITSSPDAVPIFTGTAQTGFAAMQAFFTGLSHETSLTITMRTIVEYFPTFGSALMPLASPSPAFCPTAFEIYSRTAQLAPYAVPVKQNGAGEYFRKVLAIAGSVGATIAPFMGSVGPFVGLAAAGASRLAQEIGKRQNERRVGKGKAPQMPARVRRDEAGARASPTRK